MKSQFYAFLAIPFISAVSASAEEHAHHNHSNHVNHATPTGIMKAHTHEAGEFMLSYTAKRMDMHGMRNGDSRVSTADVLASGYTMSPTEMKMDMHMFGAMYGINNDQTLAVMGQYMFNDMRIKTAMATFRTHAEGFGDTHVSIIDNLNRYNLDNWTVSYGLSLPTGNTGKTDNTPMMSNQKLPYNMQLGSGTYDILASATYQNSYEDKFDYGVQTRATVRTGVNEEGYRLGNRYEMTGWATKTITPSLNISALLDVAYRDEMTRSDKELNPNMTPTADHEQTEGTTINFGLASEYDMGNGYAIGLRGDMPLYQKYSGFQMEQDHTLTLQFKKTF